MFDERSRLYVKGRQLVAKRDLEQGICALARRDLPGLHVLPIELDMNRAVPGMTHKRGPIQHGGFLRAEHRMVTAFDETGLAIVR